MLRRIVDAHHHFWNLSLGRQPWLCEEPPIAFRYGDYSAIRRNYLQDDYLQDAQTADLEIQGSVYVETEWTVADPRGEVAHVAQMLAQQRLPTVMVAHVRLDDPQAAEHLAHHADHAFVRSIRHKPRAPPRPGPRDHSHRFPPVRHCCPRRGRRCGCSPPPCLRGVCHA